MRHRPCGTHAVIGFDDDSNWNLRLSDDDCHCALSDERATCVLEKTFAVVTTRPRTARGKG